MTGPLDGLTILVPESRELDLFVRLLEAEAAATVRCPMVQILDLEETAEAEAWIERVIAGAFQDVIWLTGEGLRRLAPIAERKGRRAAFVEALGRARMITRGPKPVRALRELGLQVGLAAETPTSQGVLDALAGEDIHGRSIGVQLLSRRCGRACRGLARSRGRAVPHYALSLRLAGRSRAGGGRDPYAGGRPYRHDRLYEFAAGRAARRRRARGRA